MKSKINSQIFFAVSIILLSCAIIYAGFQRTSSDLRNHYAVLAFFKFSQEINSSLNQNVLRSRTFLLENYDSIVSDVAQMKNLCERMTARSSPIMSSENSELTEAIRKHCNANEKKIATIENFKSKNSVLKNSLKYLPVLVAQLENTKYKNYANSLLIEVFKYNASPSEAQGHIVMSAFELLKQQANPKVNVDTDQILGSLNQHLNILLQATTERGNIEGEILSDDFKLSLAHLRRTYDNWHKVQEATATFYHYSLFAIIGFLGLVLLNIFGKLRKASVELTVANENLEEKVALRTSELSNAMTKLSQNQAMLIQATKMGALGEMAGGVAHEINTPLAAILLNSEVLMETAQENNQPEIATGLESIIKIVEKISKIINGLRRFSRDSSHDDAARALVPDIIANTLVLCQEKFKARSVHFEINDQSESRPVKCVQEQISQVLLNLFNNSLDAVCDLPPGERWIKVDVLPRDGFMEIAVTDGGQGIPENVQAKLMQPFFTTKAIGKGVGLGLSISKGIIEQHGGQFTYDSIAKNTKFVILLPQDLPRAVAA